MEMAARVTNEAAAGVAHATEVCNYLFTSNSIDPSWRSCGDYITER